MNEIRHLRLIKQTGAISLAIIALMTFFAIALPFTTKLVQQNQENRSKAVMTNESDGGGSTNKCTGYNYTNWSTCSSSGKQTRSFNGYKPSGCTGLPATSSIISQSCTLTCTEWEYSAYTTCSSSGTQTRTVTGKKPSGCTGTPYETQVTSQSCTPPAQTCSYTPGSWSECNPNTRTQTRTVTKSPDGCIGGTPLSTSQSCTPACTDYNYNGGWTTCSSGGRQSGTYNGYTPTGGCEGTPSDAPKSQSCTPACTGYNYSDWTTCSASGTRTRSVLSTIPATCTGGEARNTVDTTCTPPAQTCTSFTYTHSTCIGGNRTLTVATKSPSNCTGGNSKTSETCSMCTLYDQRCNGTRLEWCNDPNWVLTKDCPNGCDPVKFECNPAPINGACNNATVNSCSFGIFVDVTDTETQYKWQCDGVNGGSNASCAKDKPPAPAPKRCTFNAPNTYEIGAIICRGSNRSVCLSDGLWQDTSCPHGCSGNGICNPAPAPRTCFIGGKTITVGQFACDGITQVECRSTDQGYTPCTNGCAYATGKCNPAAPVKPTCTYNYGSWGSCNTSNWTQSRTETITPTDCTGGTKQPKSKNCCDTSNCVKCDNYSSCGDTGCNWDGAVCRPFIKTCSYSGTTYAIGKAICQGNIPAECLSTGAWKTFTSCTYGCSGSGVCNPAPANVCTNGSYKCDGRNLMVCKPDGSGWNLSKECGIDQTCNSSTKTCDSKTSTTIPKPSCNSKGGVCISSSVCETNYSGKSISETDCSLVCCEKTVPQISITTPDIPVTNIMVNSRLVNLEVGKLQKITVSILPATATNKDLSWASSAGSIASVDTSGNIKAVKPGSTTIKVSAKDGSETEATIAVTVVASATPEVTSSPVTNNQPECQSFPPSSIKPTGVLCLNSKVVTQPESTGSIWVWKCEDNNKEQFQCTATKFRDFNASEAIGPGRISSTCKIDSDCNSNFCDPYSKTCNIREGGKCENHFDCSETNTCIDNKCKKDDNVGNGNGDLNSVCNLTSDCKSPYVCYNEGKVKVCKVKSGGHCSYDSDCYSNHFCNQFNFQCKNNTNNYPSRPTVVDCTQTKGECYDNNSCQQQGGEVVANSNCASPNPVCCKISTLAKPPIPVKICTSDQYKCDGRNLMVCKPDGSGWNLSKECGIDQTCNSSTKTCDSKTSTTIPKPSCNSKGGVCVSTSVCETNYSGKSISGTNCNLVCCEKTVPKTSTITPNIPVTNIIVNPRSVKLEVGKFQKITTSFLPANTTNKTISWSSSDSSIASVDMNGNIKTTKPGTATVTVKSSDNSNVKASIEVIVKTEITSPILPSCTSQGGICVNNLFTCGDKYSGKIISGTDCASTCCEKTILSTTTISPSKCDPNKDNNGDGVINSADQLICRGGGGGGLPPTVVNSCITSGGIPIAQDKYICDISDDNKRKICAPTSISDSKLILKNTPCQTGYECKSNTTIGAECVAKPVIVTCTDQKGICLSLGQCKADNGSSLGKFDCSGTNVCCKTSSNQTLISTSKTVCKDSGGKCITVTEVASCKSNGGTISSVTTECSSGTPVCCVGKPDTGTTQPPQTCSVDQKGVCQPIGECKADNGSSLGKFDCTGTNVCCQVTIISETSCKQGQQKCSTDLSNLQVCSSIDGQYKWKDRFCADGCDRKYNLCKGKCGVGENQVMTKEQFTKVNLCQYGAPGNTLTETRYGWSWTCGGTLHAPVECSVTNSDLTYQKDCKKDDDCVSFDDSGNKLTKCIDNKCMKRNSCVTTQHGDSTITWTGSTCSQDKTKMLICNNSNNQTSQDFWKFDVVKCEIGCQDGKCKDGKKCGLYKDWFKTEWWSETYVNNKKDKSVPCPFGCNQTNGECFVSQAEASVTIIPATTGSVNQCVSKGGSCMENLGECKVEGGTSLGKLDCTLGICCQVKQPINGICGNVNAFVDNQAPSINQMCQSGTFVLSESSEARYNWLCVGSNNGTTAKCTTTKKIATCNGSPLGTKQCVTSFLRQECTYWGWEQKDCTDDETCRDNGVCQKWVAPQKEGDYCIPSTGLDCPRGVNIDLYCVNNKCVNRVDFDKNEEELKNKPKCTSTSYGLMNSYYDPVTACPVGLSCNQQTGICQKPEILATKKDYGQACKTDAECKSTFCQVMSNVGGLSICQNISQKEYIDMGNRSAAIIGGAIVAAPVIAAGAVVAAQGISVAAGAMAGYLQNNPKVLDGLTKAYVLYDNVDDVVDATLGVINCASNPSDPDCQQFLVYINTPGIQANLGKSFDNLVGLGKSALNSANKAVANITVELAVDSGKNIDEVADVVDSLTDSSEIASKAIIQDFEKPITRVETEASSFGDDALISIQNSRYTSQGGGQQIIIDPTNDEELSHFLTDSSAYIKANRQGNTKSRVVLAQEYITKNNSLYDGSEFEVKPRLVIANQQSIYNQNNGVACLGQFIGMDAMVCREQALLLHTTLANVGKSSEVVAGEIYGGRHAWVELVDSITGEKTVADSVWHFVLPQQKAYERYGNVRDTIRKVFVTP